MALLGRGVTLASLVLFVAVGLLLARPTGSNPAGVSILWNGKTISFDRERMASLPHVSVRPSYRDRQSQFEGVPLSALLASAGIQTGYSLSGSNLRDIVLVEAADGEGVTFSLSEIDNTYSDSTIILADKEDGRELTVRDWPRIVAPKDKRMDRWLPQVVALHVLSAQ